MDTQGTASTDSSNANVALGLSGAAVLLLVVAMFVATDGNDWLWPLAALLGGIGAFLGWRAGRPKLQGKALAAVVAGGLVFLYIVGWIVWAAATGNFD
jgi:hypothetical protein